MFIHTMDYFDTFVYVIEVISITAFGISGAMVGIRKGMDLFGVIMLAMTTSVGGGLLRDVMAQNMPYIFVKHFYASPCLVGSIVCVIMWETTGRIPAMIVGTIVIIFLRWLAATFRWNLPHVPAELYAKPGEPIPESHLKRENRK